MPTKDNWLDRLYKNGRAKAAGAVSAKVGVKMTNFLAIPADLTYMLLRLMLDPDVSGGRKLDFGMSVVYLFLPIDIIPDKWPILGKIDDVYVVLSAVAKVLRGVDREILLRYWQGDPAMLDGARNFLIKLDEKLGFGLTKNLLRYAEKATAAVTA
jgi:uncharacterized membrane protein YkvA (DUF1232 family)